jgi:hypothetical protein
MMITSNVNTSCGLAQGSVGRLIDWDFPVGTEYKVVAIDDDHNSLVRVPFLNGFITQPTCVYFKLVSHKLIAKPAGQPDNLPEDVVALPLRTSTAKLSFEKLPGHNRTSVTVTMTQIPLRAANALTTYSVQGKQFNRYCIFETQATQCFILRYPEVGKD